MATITGTILDEEVPRARVALLLEHFSELGDDREPWRVMYPLKEVLLLVVCATIASCDDFYDIVAWGEHHLDFLRRFGLPSWYSVRALGADARQPGRSNPVRTLLRQLGGGAMAWPARPYRYRWQDGAAHPRPAQRAQSLAYAQRLRDLGAAGPGAAQRAGKDQ